MKEKVTYVPLAPSHSISAAFDDKNALISITRAITLAIVDLHFKMVDKLL